MYGAGFVKEMTINGAEFAFVTGMAQYEVEGLPMRIKCYDKTGTVDGKLRELLGYRMAQDSYLVICLQYR